MSGARRLREEIFYLAYHLHWSRAEIMNLAIAERAIYVGMLAEHIDAENRAREAAYDRERRS